jgi:pheromone shutdown protein TraB
MQKPDTVMVELDSKRVAKVKGTNLEDFGFVLPQVYSSSYPSSAQKADPQVTIPASREQPLAKTVGGATSFFSTLSNKAGSLVLGKALSGFYNKVESMGFTAGGEFKAAVEEARSLGSKVLLGDRDVDETLSHLFEAFRTTSPDQLSAMSAALELMEQEQGLFSSPGLTSKKGGVDATFEGMTKPEMTEMMEKIKTRKSINQLTTIMRDNVPQLYKALIQERDVFMADALADSMLGGIGDSNSNSKSIVAVCGFAHVVGMEQRLLQRNFKLRNRNC